MTEREDIRRAMFDALRVEDHPCLTDVMPTDVWRLWSAAWNAAKLYGAEEQKNAMIADGWRQCAQGQGASQFCEQVEMARQEARRLEENIRAEGVGAHDAPKPTQQIARDTYMELDHCITQCQEQERHNLDPEFCLLMASVAGILQRVRPVILTGLAWLGFQSGANANELYSALLDYSGGHADLPAEEDAP